LPFSKELRVFLRVTAAPRHGGSASNTAATMRSLLDWAVSRLNCASLESYVPIPKK